MPNDAEQDALIFFQLEAVKIKASKQGLYGVLRRRLSAQDITGQFRHLAFRLQMRQDAQLGLSDKPNSQVTESYLNTTVGFRLIG